MPGFDAGAIVRWTGEYEDDNLIDRLSPKRKCRSRTGPTSFILLSRGAKVGSWITLDLIASYTFNLAAPSTAEVPGFAKDGGKNVKTKDGKEKSVIPSRSLHPTLVDGTPG